MLRKCRSLRIWMPSLLLGAVLTLSILAAAPAKKKASPESKAKRGEYLSAVMGCQDCHTPGYFWGAPDFARSLSGSEMGWQGPWGVTYARNLTPDVETGLGRWKEADIVKALRHGVRPDGVGLLPPMPWQDFSRLTDDDAFAIAAYLKSIPPVKHKVPDRLGPEAKPTGPSLLVVPPPSEWDAPKKAPGGAPK